MQGSPRERVTPIAVDLGLALLVTALLLVGSEQEVRHWPGTLALGPAAFALLAAAGMVLVARRHLPLFTYAASLAAAGLYLLAGWPPGPVYVAPFVALVTLVAAARPATWLVAGVLGAVLLALAHVGTVGTILSAAIWSGVWLALTGISAVWIRLRRRYLAEATARAEWAERTQAEAARRRVAEERLGIAREMHDVVGHSLAVISLQAGVAEHLLAARPEEARRAVAAIRQVSHEALTELRAELALLRGEGVAGERGPIPDLRTLPRLVASMRDAGLPVELDFDVDQQAVPEVVAQAAYRITQESLTNVARHAGTGARARVWVHLEHGELEVEVVDDGRGAPAAPAGTGIDGMRERVAALGGRFAAGNRPDGGFRIWASIPSPAR